MKNEMYCQNRIVYTVQAGDSLYQLSRQYHTTVTELILGNPGVNPYNLQIGMQLNICPGEGYVAPGESAQTPGGNMQMPGENTQMPGQSMQTPGQSMQRPGGNMQMPGENMQTPGGNMQMPGQNMQRPGGNMQMPGQSMQTPGQMEENPGQQAEDAWQLREAMRLAWLDHVYWSRMFLSSVAADAKDQPEVEERLLQTADEITDVFSGFFPNSAARQLQNLLTEHIELAGELIHTLKSGNMENYDSIIRNWYANANQLASFLGSQNPYFGGRETRNMLLNHLDVTRQEIEQQLNGAYAQSIETFRDVKNQALEMADYFAEGLMAR